jgi:hypothetical protein
MFGSSGVLLGLVVVDGAIDFDDEVGSGAVEVENERPDRVLITEAESSDLSITQRIPEYSFGRRQLAAESLCVLQEWSRDPANAQLCALALHITTHRCS